MPENLRSHLLQFITILMIVLPSLNRAEIVSRYFNDAKVNSLFNTKPVNHNNLNKVSLTQKGYIQVCKVKLDNLVVYQVIRFFLFFSSYDT